MLSLNASPVARRRSHGKELRQQVPRSSHGRWLPAADRPDPVALLIDSDGGRVPDLVPLRYGLMLESPFAYLRGSAIVMAHDLSSTPIIGPRVQACGDAHLMNFGAFATPEQMLVFDVNDFDETLPAPWEWDVKRLVASVHVAGRHLGLSENQSSAAVATCSRAYRERLRDYADQSALEVWNARIDIARVIADSGSAAERRRLERGAARARTRTGPRLVEKLTEVTDAGRRLRDKPPRAFHPADTRDYGIDIHSFLPAYRESLPDERRLLFDRYRCLDVAVRVVGVGSVGTRCLVGLFEADAGDILFLQFKEARPSVLEPFAGPSAYTHQGQRVVVGQRLMQSVSDGFLGWARSTAGDHDFYVRQLRGLKIDMTIDDFSAAELADYAALCGWALARAHAKSGDAATIGGYVGTGDTFDAAMIAFAATYADQTERDHAALSAAVRSGRVHAAGESE